MIDNIIMGFVIGGIVGLLVRAAKNNKNGV